MHTFIQSFVCRQIRLGLILLVVASFGPAREAAGQANGILREVWLDMGGSAVADLTNNAAFPNSPTFDDVLTDFFEAPANAYENYGQRLRALITAPQTGNYRFWISSDDASQLFVSTSASPANRQLVASVTSWTSARQWNKEASQQSALIPLVAGQKYYLEALMKEGNGGDNLAVRWQLPNSTIEEPIPASRCEPYGLTVPVVSSQPTNVTVLAGGVATFSVSLVRTGGVTFQWKRDGANISGATNSAYTLALATMPDSGSTFFCAITNAAGGTQSATATLTVLPNTNLTGILREVWLNIDGNNVADLTNNPAFPNQPSFDEVLTDLFETPSNAFDQYGQRLRALVTAPVTGNYRFWIASDDGGQLWVSSDATPANRQLVASVTLWTGPREWTKELNQRSALIPLVAGQRYYVEALMKEGGGGDNLAVRWQLPGGAIEEPIPAVRCEPFGLGVPQITSHPANVAVSEGGAAAFSVSLARTFGATYQWKRNGTNLPGATASSFAFAPVALSDNGSTFYCAVTNNYGGTNSLTATLTVLADTTRPTLVSAANLGNPNRVTVQFSEAVEAATATNAANYALNLGAVISAVRLIEDNRTVVLETSSLGAGLIYTLTVNNVRDRATTPNTILPNSQIQISTVVTPLDIRYVIGTNEPAGPSSRRTALAITEIMYNPTNRPDGRNLEFIELYNSNPWAEDVSGYRFSGAASYTFPPGTSVPARGYRVVAAVPGDVVMVHGLAGVLGPLTESASGNTTNVLSNGGGTVRLHDELGAVLLELEYDDEAPWPVAPDGAGHSLVLARPSYGEAAPRAWAASDRVGGSPGAEDVPTTNPWRTVLINEILAHTDLPLEDYVELYNYSNVGVDVGNCILSDHPTENRYVIPAGTVIPARGWLSFTQTQLGFALSAEGETVYLKAPDGSRVIDALRFEAQENGVALGRFPDGAPQFRRLSQRTLGGANAAPRISDVIISELQYHPVTEDDDEEFVEIRNRGAAPVSLSGWRLLKGITFTFPDGTTLPAGGAVVVARNPATLMQAHPALNAAQVFGPFSGRLSNSGEIVQLTMPDDIASPSSGGQWVTNRINIAVDEVNYGTGGRWGAWADGGGSSLERTDLRGYGGFPNSWADSDESAKSAWSLVEFTGLLDNGGMTLADQLQILLLGPGECLVDNVEVLTSGGVNLVTNGTFTSGTAGWFMQGTHQDSQWQPGGGYSGGCLRIVASDRGDTGANRIRTVLAQPVSSGTTATIRARVRWLKGHPEILLRLRGNWLEASGSTLTTRALGTPGAPNSQQRTNLGPAITGVSHWPVLPAAGEAVTVTAQIEDPDGLAVAALKYRVEPGTNFVSVPLNYRGAGFFAATIPGQAAGTQVAFYLEAYDGSVIPMRSQFPSEAPERECLVRFGEPAGLPLLGTYRLWVTGKNVARWAAREKQSNHPLDATFVYGDTRVCYNVNTLYSGSPWHTPGYSGPAGAACDYELNLAKDELVLGASDFVLATAGNLNSDPTYQGEQAAYWIGRKLGAPYMHRRHIRVFFNGQQRGNVYEDAQQPSRAIVRQYFPNDDAGSLHKIEDWFEFDDSGDNKLGNVDATLENFTTTGGAKKTERYRWNWRPRSVRESANDFTNLFTLVDAMNAPQPEPYRSLIANLVDVEEWMRILAMERIVGNWDSYGYNRGKNMYAYKPSAGPWQLLPWDIDFVFNVGGDGPTTALFGGNEPVLNQLRAFPEFQRAYWRAFQAAVDGPLDAATFASRVDGIYNGLVTAGVGPDFNTTQGLKTYVAARRNYLLTQLSTVAANFSVNGPANFATNRNFITLTGSAPIGVARLTVNGTPVQPTWSSVTGWTLRIALQPGVNALTIAGWDTNGQPVGGASASLTITFTGTLEPAEQRIVINEIMYHPTAPAGEFLELHSTATNTAYDLSGWRVRGLDFTIPPGTLLEPGGFLVFVENQEEFWRAYGNSIPVAGGYAGKLDNAGETVQLIRPGATPAQDTVISQVTYHPGLPWPGAAAGTGPSLQLVDPTRDINRVANWAVATSGALYTPGTTNSVRAAKAAFPTLWLNELLPVNSASVVNAVADRFGEYEPWVELFNGGTNAIALANFYLTTNYQQPTLWAFPGGGMIQPGEFKVIFLDGEPGEANATEWHTSFRLNSGAGALALTYVAGGQTNVLDYLNYNVPSVGRSYGSYPDGNASDRRLFSAITPGAANDAAGLPVQVYINEWLADNVATLADPADGNFEDWFEVFNPGTEPVDLGGYYFTDNLTNKVQFRVPDNGHYVVPAGGYLLVWADNEANQNSTNRTDLHVNFALSKSGEAIGLFTAAGTVVDAVTFGAQTTDVTEGRFPDGSATIMVLTQPTPRAANFVTQANTPPELDDLPNRTVGEGTLLTFTATATDANFPPQTLSFSLEPGFPSGAAITAGGVFTWIPTEAQGPGSYPITIRVTDNGTPPLSDTGTFTVNVQEVNQPPQLVALGNVTLLAGRTLNITNSATDADVPQQALTFELVSGPAGMAVHPGTGVLTWRPLIAQSGTTNTVVVRVADNGVPSLTDTETFTAVVLAPAAPVLSLAALNNGNFSFQVSGDFGPDYVLERNLTIGAGVWVPVITNLAPALPFQWTTPVPPGAEKAWYRVRLMP